MQNGSHGYIFLAEESVVETSTERLSSCWREDERHFFRRVEIAAGSTHAQTAQEAHTYST